MSIFSAIARFSAVDKYSSTLARMTTNTNKFANASVSTMRRVEMVTKGAQRATSGLSSELKSFAGAIAITGLLAAGASAVVQYDKSVASLQAITGATSEQMVGYKKVVMDTAKETKSSAVDMLTAFEMVGSAKPELLASADALGEVSKQALTLSRAGKLEMADAVNALTTSMNQFGAGAEEAAAYTDILATAQQKGSGTISFLADAIVKSGGVMKAFGNSFEDTIAILEGFAKAGVPASEAGTMLSGIMSKLSKVSQKEFNPQYTKATDIIQNLAKANLSYTDLMKLTDAEGAKWLTQIIGQNDVVQQLTGNLNETGNAQAQAALNTATLSDKFSQLTAAYGNAVVANTEASVGVSMFSGVLTLLADNMDWIIGLILGTASVLLPMIAAYKIAGFVTTAYSTAVGIAALIQGKSALTLKGNVIALNAYKTAVAVATAVQWAWNAAMTANPIGLIIAGIMAVIGVVALLVKHWDTLKEKFTKAPMWVKALAAPFIFMAAPLLIVVNLIRKLIDNWNGIKKAFSEGGFIEGMKKLGGVILSALIDPLLFFLKLLAKVPGLGGAISPIIANVEDFQRRVEGNDEEAPIAPVNTQATQNQVQSEIVEKQQQSVTIDVNDPKQKLNVGGSAGPVPIRVNGTSYKGN